MYKPAGDQFFECELTQEGLLDSVSHLLQGLRNLGLGTDSSQTILAAADDATDSEVAAELTLALGALPQRQQTCCEHELGKGGQEQEQRQLLASESYGTRYRAGRKPLPQLIMAGSATSRCAHSTCTSLLPLEGKS